MQANLDALGGVVHSGEVLLVLTRAGISREDAYAIVQRSAMATWTGLGQPGSRDFRANLDADPEIAARIATRVARRSPCAPTATCVHRRRFLSASSPTMFPPQLRHEPAAFLQPLPSAHGPTRRVQYDAQALGRHQESHRSAQSALPDGPYIKHGMSRPPKPGRNRPLAGQALRSDNCPLYSSARTVGWQPVQYYGSPAKRVGTPARSGADRREEWRRHHAVGFRMARCPPLQPRPGLLRGISPAPLSHCVTTNRLRLLPALSPLFCRARTLDLPPAPKRLAESWRRRSGDNGCLLL